MKFEPGRIADDLLEMASEQRLDILLHIEERKMSISRLAETLGATKSEIHRNVNRLARAGLVERSPDGDYALTTYGSAALVQIPSIAFMSENREYFATHTLGNLEPKFVQRLGALHEKKQVTGFVRVLERWKAIHENAEEYIYNILSEVPYSGDIIDVIISKLESKVRIRSIFAERAAIPEARKRMFAEKGFQRYVSGGLLERRIMEDVRIVVLVTEKEAAAFFPVAGGEPDLSTMFFSSDPQFHDWCCDYFEWSWKGAATFQESRLKSG